jgi:hypothetical protein
MLYPAAFIRAIIAGFDSTFLPIQKNVAFALNSAKLSNTKSVISGVGPSSNVKYISCSLFFNHVKRGKRNEIKDGIL